MVVGGPCDYCVSPVQRIGFWGFSHFFRTFGSGLGTVGMGDLDLDLGLTINNTFNAIISKTKYFRLPLSYEVRRERPETDLSL